MTDEATILLRAASEVRAEFGRRGAGMNISVTQAVVLDALGGHPGSTQLALSRAIGVDKSTLSTMLHTMKGRGWLTIKRNEASDRETVVELTARGDEMLEHARKYLRATSISVMNRVHPGSRAKFASGLREIVEAK